MSIEDEQGQTLITLTGLWDALFKVFLVLLAPVTVAFMGWCTWVTIGIIELRRDTIEARRELAVIYAQVHTPYASPNALRTQ